MVRYSSPQTRRIALWCYSISSILFACFSFCYLYLYQADYLAQLQFHFSHGETTYQGLIGASLITLPLLALGFFTYKAVHWPLRLSALSWFPSAFLLTAITSVRLPELPGFESGTPVFGLVFSLVLFLGLMCLCCMHPDATSERTSVSSALSCNLFVLALLFLMVGGMGYSSEMGHRELRAGRLFFERKYGEAVRQADRVSMPSHRLFALRAASLAMADSLGQALFAQPVPHATARLLPDASDSLFVYNVLPVIYHNMKAVPASGVVTDEGKFLQRAFDADTVARPLLFDYLLCSCLLRRDLHQFSHLITTHADSLSVELPVHYREALVMLPSAESLMPDSLMRSSFNRFTSLHRLAEGGDKACADSLSAYATTYWAYYFSGVR